MPESATVTGSVRTGAITTLLQSVPEPNRDPLTAMWEELPPEWRKLEVITTDGLTDLDLSNTVPQSGGLHLSSYERTAEVVAKHFLYVSRVQSRRILSRAACRATIAGLKIVLPVIDRLGLAKASCDILESAVAADVKARGLPVRYHTKRSCGREDMVPRPEFRAAFALGHHIRHFCARLLPLDERDYFRYSDLNIRKTSGTDAEFIDIRIVQTIGLGHLWRDFLLSHTQLSWATLMGWQAHIRRFDRFLLETQPSGYTSRVIDQSTFEKWKSAELHAGRATGTNTAIHRVYRLLRDAVETEHGWAPTRFPAFRVGLPYSVKPIDELIAEAPSRAISHKDLDQLGEIIPSLPRWVGRVFLLVRITGLRRTDAHSIRHDCLKDDDDPRFAILSAYQSKVRAWNSWALDRENEAHAALIAEIYAQRDEVLAEHGAGCEFLFPSPRRDRQTGEARPIGPANSAELINNAIKAAGLLGPDGKPIVFRWHSLRHRTATDLALQGQDIFLLMSWLGHKSSRMTYGYVNERLTIKKNAIRTFGAGYTVDVTGILHSRNASDGDVAMQKLDVATTKVEGGWCNLNAKLGDWCERANPCFDCKHFRADPDDLDLFKRRAVELKAIADSQLAAAAEHVRAGQKRLADIFKARADRNLAKSGNLGTIASVVEGGKIYSGTRSMFIREQTS